MNCDCNMPDCMECFLQRCDTEREMFGCLDKSTCYEGMDLERKLAIEEQIEIPEEIYNLKDSW